MDNKRHCSSQLIWNELCKDVWIVQPFLKSRFGRGNWMLFPTGNKSSFCVLVNNSSLFWSAPLSWLTHIGLKMKESDCFDFPDNAKIRTNNLKTISSFELIDHGKMKINHEPHCFEIQWFELILRGVLLKVQVQKAMTEESLLGPEYSLWYPMIVGLWC